MRKYIFYVAVEKIDKVLVVGGMVQPPAPSPTKCP